jgi:signal transduction histidine kinase
VSEHLTLLAPADAGAPWPSPGKAFHSLLGLVTDAVARVRVSDGVVLDFHPAQESDLSIAPERVRGRHLTELLPGRLATEAIALAESALRSGRMQAQTVEIPLNSLAREIEARAVPLADDEVLALLRDVTDRQRLEKEILEISHREQQRIGQDLHDSLGQHLTGISFLSKALQTKLKALKIPEAAQAGEVAELVVQTLAHTRNIARGLFPVELETTGRLLPALTELVANTEKLFRVTCHLESDPAIDIAHPRVSTELFRIAQEAISNAIKHGKARRVCVRVQATGPGAARLVVQDDGSGIPAGRQGPGMGLRIMNFRAGRIGGRLEVARMELGGTAVVCDFPLPRSET